MIHYWQSECPELIDLLDWLFHETSGCAHHGLTSQPCRSPFSHLHVSGQSFEDTLREEREIDKCWLVILKCFFNYINKDNGGWLNIPIALKKSKHIQYLKKTIPSILLGHTVYHHVLRTVMMKNLWIQKWIKHSLL